MTTRTCNLKKKWRRCLKCGRKMHTDRCHRLCLRCREENLNHPEIHVLQLVGVDRKAYRAEAEQLEVDSDLDLIAMADLLGDE
jgi:hypothetical protein